MSDDLPPTDAEVMNNPKVRELKTRLAEVEAERAAITVNTLRIYEKFEAAKARAEAAEARVAELEAERDEADDLAKAAFADGASNNILLAEAAHRIKLLETRSKEAVETLRVGFKSCDPTKTAAAIILAIAQLEGHGE